MKERRTSHKQQQKYKKMKTTTIDLIKQITRHVSMRTYQYLPIFFFSFVLLEVFSFVIISFALSFVNTLHM